MAVNETKSKSKPISDMIQFFVTPAEVSLVEFARAEETAAATSGEKASRPVRPGKPGH
jgi:hypothetical protein